MAEEVKLKAVDFSATMTSATRIQALEADVKIEAKYIDEPEFIVVSDTTMMKGEVKSEGGLWEEVPAGKELEQRRVTITPKNIAWYQSRTDIRAMQAGPGDYMGDPGEEFKLEPTKKRTKQVRKDELDAAKESKLSKLKA
jgi:hypothetical protein